MSNLLPTDELTVNIKCGQQTVQKTIPFSEFFQTLYAYCFEEFGIPKEDEARYGLYQENGSRLPKAVRIYDNMEVVDRCTLEFKLRE